MLTNPDNSCQESPRFLIAPGSFFTLKKDSTATYPTITWAEIVDRLPNPTAKAKRDADLILASSYNGHDGRNHAAQCRNGVFWMLPVDVDKGDISKEALIEALEAILGEVEMAIYSSASATPENRKWRALVPLSQPLAGPEYNAYANALYDELEARGITCDRTLAHYAQPIYLNNVPPEKRVRGAPLFYDYEPLAGPYLDAKACAALRDRAEDLIRERGAYLVQVSDAMRKPIDPTTPWGYAAREFPIESLLEQFGYIRQENLYGGFTSDFKSPYSSGYSTRVIGDSFVTLSYSDAERGIGREAKTKGAILKGKRENYRYGGSLDLIAFYQFDNDRDAAVSAIREMMDEDHKAATTKVGAAIARMAEETGEDLEPPYILTPKGKPEMNMANIQIALEHLRAWRDVFAFNVLSNRPILTKGIPGTRGTHTFTKPKDLTDAHITATHRWFQSNGFSRIARSAIQEAVDAQCRFSEYHPIQSYLESVRGQEQEGLLDQWLTLGFGVQPENDDQAEYARAVGRAWLISAVARVIQPGCKADGVLVLEGMQGKGKSTALRWLAGGDDHFTDHLPPLHTKDASSAVQGMWIIEMAELGGISKADIDTKKEFFTRQIEKYRPSYMRLEVSYPRQCVFAATTNRTEYLRDPTGNRRFWPVRCGEVDLAWIKANRDALFAEALKAYEAGEAWHLSSNVEGLARAEQAARHTGDTIDAEVRKRARELKKMHGFVPFGELVKNVIGEHRDVKHADINRVRDALSGWPGAKKLREEKARNKWRDQWLWDIPDEGDV